MVIGTVSGSLQVGKDGTLTVTVGNVTGSPAFFFNGVQVNANLTGTANVFTVSVPASLLTSAGNTGNLGVQASNGKAAVTLTVAAAAAVTPPAPPPAPPLVTNPLGTIQGHGYNSKATYLQALATALNSISSGPQSIDTWNWYMINSLNPVYLVGGVGPDPTPVTAQLGIGRGDSTTASNYISALDSLGYIVYPTGLSGFSGLAAGISRMNKHPLAGRIRPRKEMLQ